MKLKIFLCTIPIRPITALLTLTRDPGVHDDDDDVTLEGVHGSAHTDDALVGDVRDEGLVDSQVGHERTGDLGRRVGHLNLHGRVARRGWPAGQR